MRRSLLLCFVVALFVPAGASAATNLPVPFTSQAPFFDWREPWQNACEEATIAMVDAFYHGKTFTQASGRDAIVHALNIKNNRFGWSLDEDANKMQKLVNEYYTWETYIVENPTIEMLKAEVDSNRPVIVLAYGKELHNPYFRGAPEYHTYVISGYDDLRQEFITQEPGTKHGNDLRYPYGTVIESMHDFVPGNTRNGRKVSLFTRPQSTALSLATDGDDDGLLKRDEMLHGSALWLADSDGDGYSDGVEVAKGFLPTRDELGGLNGALVKTQHDHKVYLVQNGVKRHIDSPAVFERHGWDWGAIRLVSNRIIQYLNNGTRVL